MPGAGCARGPRAKKVHGAVTTGSAGRHRHSLRNGVTAYTALSPVNGVCLPPLPGPHRQARMDATVAAPGPHGFAVRLLACRPVKHHRTPQTAIAARASYRDDHDPSLLMARGAVLMA